LALFTAHGAEIESWPATVRAELRI
jgi:hypothetical protein